MSHTEIEALADHAAREAGEVLIKYLGKADIHEKETTQNLVTQADLESEALVRELILQRFPEHQIMGEETEFRGQLDAEHLWVVDPLDGTNNFAHGIPQFCVSIAYLHQGTPTVGAIWDPIRQEMFQTTLGRGAYLNGEPIRVTAPEGLQQAVVATGFYYDRGEIMQRTLGAIETLFQHQVRGIRRMGAAALDLAWVACGRFQAFFEYQLAPWDYAAGALLVEEAGGICRSADGTPMTIDAQSVIASSATIADQMVELVALRQ